MSEVKKINNKLLSKGLIAILVVSLVGLNGDTYAATSPTLTGALSYSVLGATTVTNTGLTTTAGNVGVTPGTDITGFPPGIASGDNLTHLHSNDASAISAQADNLTSFGALDQACDHSYPDGQDLTLLSPLVPGVYCSAGSFLLTGNLTLSGSGVWIFKTVSSLVTSSGSSVTGGDPCNVWWRIGSSATLGTTTSFIGNILALTSISLNTGTTLNGRALAQTGAVTLNANTITGPTCVVASESDTASTPSTPTTPGLPNTGYASRKDNSIPENLSILTGIIIAAISMSLIIRKKHKV
jgi:hypothetical protein